MSANTVDVPHFNIPYSEKRGLPRGVYRVSDGVYRARVKYGRKLYSLGRYRNVRDAENAIRKWYVESFGNHASDASSLRLVTPWRVVWRDDLKIYQLVVFIAGYKVYIAPPKKDGWNTKQEAKEYYPIWARKRFGNIAVRSAWRSDWCYGRFPLSGVELQHHTTRVIRMSQPASINTGCVQGETFSLSLIWKDKDTGTPIDVTDYTGAMQVRLCPDESPVLSWSSAQSDIVFGGANGSIIVTGESADTVSVPAGVYSYDLKVISPGNVTRVIAAGKFTVLARVTQ